MGRAKAKRFSINDARERRAAKAAALGDLARGQVTVTQVLCEPPVALSGVDVWDVLLRCPTLGREGVRQVLERASVWPHTPLGELGAHERSSIIAHLPPRLQLEA